MNTTSDLMLTAASLGAGEKQRILCPFCGGGRTGQKSMDLSRLDDGVVVWNCHRASCKESGARGDGNLVRTRHTPRKQTTKPYTGELLMLDDEQERYLEETIGWTAEHLLMGAPRWAPEDSRYAFPVYGPMGTRRGYVMRSYAGAEPKALTRMDMAEPHMSWYRHNGDASVAVVVEDIPSAVRAAKYVNAVALCGTGCGPDYAHEIAAHTPNVVWALDADATAMAVKLHRKYALMFLTSRVQPLGCDIKDMQEADVAQLLGGKDADK